MFINEKNNISLMEDILNDVKERIDDINISFIDNKEMNKEEYICKLLYTLGYYSFSSYIDYFDMIPEIQQQDYCRYFMVAFCNHYVKSQSTPSSKLIGYNVFF